MGVWLQQKYILLGPREIIIYYLLSLLWYVYEKRGNKISYCVVIAALLK